MRIPPNKPYKYLFKSIKLQKKYVYKVFIDYKIVVLFIEFGIIIIWDSNYSNKTKLLLVVMLPIYTSQN